MKDVATADAWYATRDTWREEVAALRHIALDVGLIETLKWRHPCYMDRNKNIAIVGYKRDCALVSLLKGALVSDPRGRLVRPGQDRSGRYLPFTSVAQIDNDRGYLETLLTQAIQVERDGKRVPPLPDEIDYCEELAQRMATDEAFRAAFEALTTGRRRHYNLHFSKAKQSSTRESRVDACTERILAGKGLRDCICGRSKRMPSCDGSHRSPA